MVLGHGLREAGAGLLMGRYWTAFAVCFCAFGCDEAVVPQAPSSYLVVKPAREQPSDAMGSIFVVDAKGGDLVRVRTRGGLHEYSTSSEPVSRSCVVNATYPLFLYVLPTSEEVLVFVDLLLSEADEDDAGSSPQTIESDCSGSLVEGRLLRWRTGPAAVNVDEDAGVGP